MTSLTLIYPYHWTLGSRQVFLLLICCLLFLWICGCLEDPEVRFMRLDQEAEARYANREYKAALEAWERAQAREPVSEESP